MKKSCPKCGKPYKLIDRIGNPSMCARCFAKINPDPFHAAPSIVEAKVVITTGSDHQSGVHLRKAGVQIAATGALMTSSAFLALIFLANTPNVAVTPFIVVPPALIIIFGAIQVMRGLYLIFGSGRALASKE